MRPVALFLFLAACGGGGSQVSTSFEDRIGALEARYHAQQKQIDDLRKEVDALKAAKGAPAPE